MTVANFDEMHYAHGSAFLVSFVRIKMTTGTKTVEISAAIFEVARRTASLDNVDVSTLLESLVRRHAEDIDTFEEFSAGMPRFSLKHYKPQRDPGETDEEFEARVSLFR